jgi:hypothetical protein
MIKVKVSPMLRMGRKRRLEPVTLSHETVQRQLRLPARSHLLEPQHNAHPTLTAISHHRTHTPTMIAAACRCFVLASHHPTTHTQYLLVVCEATAYPVVMLVVGALCWPDNYTCRRAITCAHKITEVRAAKCHLYNRPYAWTTGA